MSQKAYLQPKDWHPEHSSKRQVDLDAYMFELASEMHVQETQQIFCFHRLYWRFRRRYAPPPRHVDTEGEENLIETFEPPIHKLEEAIAVFTGIKAETLFYHLYAQSIHPAEPGDTNGTFNPGTFA